MDSVARELVKIAKELTAADEAYLSPMVKDYSDAVNDGILSLLEKESKKLEGKLRKFIGANAYNGRLNNYGVLKDVKVKAEKGFGVKVMLETSLLGKKWLLSDDLYHWYFKR